MSSGIFSRLRMAMHKKTKMYFLGQASRYDFGRTVKHLFAYGSKSDSLRLANFLAKHYHVETNQVALYHNGRSALAAGLRQLLPKGSGVIITSLTCSAVVQAVKAAGCKPIFADIDRERLHYGIQELQETFAKHPEAKAISIQNNLGIPVDIARLEQFANDHDLAIIEDLAHCAGIRYGDGREAGMVGQIVALSFGKGKSIDTISGGALISRIDSPIEQPQKRPSISDSMRDRWYPAFALVIRALYRLRLGKFLTAILIKIHFIEKSADAKLDTNTRLPHWQAKLALSQLEQLTRINQAPLRQPLLVSNRDEVLCKLEKSGYVFNDTWYDVLVSPARYYNKYRAIEKECPVATEISQQLINFPTWYSKSDLREANKIIKDYLI